VPLGSNPHPAAPATAQENGILLAKHVLRLCKFRTGNPILRIYLSNEISHPACSSFLKKMLSCIKVFAA
jgi:hypothetical protein